MFTAEPQEACCPLVDDPWAAMLFTCDLVNPAPFTAAKNTPVSPATVMSCCWSCALCSSLLCINMQSRFAGCQLLNSNEDACPVSSWLLWRKQPCMCAANCYPQKPSPCVTSGSFHPSCFKWGCPDATSQGDCCGDEGCGRLYSFAWFHILRNYFLFCIVKTSSYKS